MKITNIACAGLIASVSGFAGIVHAAEPIVGNWKTEAGETARISSCGGAFCITVKTGQYAGKRIGKLAGSGSKYSGTITDPSDDKTYSGSAKVSGASMSLRGCALKIFCKTQKWNKN